MALDQINPGNSANDGTGTPLRTAAGYINNIISLMWDTITGGIEYTGGSIKISNSQPFIILNDTSPDDSPYLVANLGSFYINFNTQSATGAKFVLESDGSTKIKGVFDNTTASAENVNVQSDGSLLLSTSSERAKKDIVPISSEYSANIYQIAKKAAIFYKSLSKADNKDWTFYGLSAEKLALIEPRLVHFGYVQEDYETLTREIEVEEVVKSKNIFKKYNKIKVIKHEKYKSLKKDAKMTPVGVQYSRTIPLMLVEMDRQNDRINDLEKRLLALEK